MKSIRNWVLGLLAAIAISLGWMAYAATSLSWVAPTQNTDGSPLTDLAGYKVYRRASATTGTYAFLANTTSVSYTDNAPLEGVNCYVVTAVDTAVPPNESANSNQACKTVDTLRPAAPTGLTVN